MIGLTASSQSVSFGTAPKIQVDINSYIISTFILASIITRNYRKVHKIFLTNRHCTAHLFASLSGQLRGQLDTGSVIALDVHQTVNFLP